MPLTIYYRDNDGAIVNPYIRKTQLDCMPAQDALQKLNDRATSEMAEQVDENPLQPNLIVVSRMKLILESAQIAIEEEANAPGPGMEQPDTPGVVMETGATYLTNETLVQKSASKKKKKWQHKGRKRDEREEEEDIIVRGSNGKRRKDRNEEW